MYLFMKPEGYKGHITKKHLKKNSTENEKLQKKEINLIKKYIHVQKIFKKYCVKNLNTEYSV